MALLVPVTDRGRTLLQLRSPLRRRKLAIPNSDLFMDGISKTRFDAIEFATPKTDGFLIFIMRAVERSACGE